MRCRDIDDIQFVPAGCQHLSVIIKAARRQALRLAATQTSIRRWREEGVVSASATNSISGMRAQLAAYSAAFRPAPMTPSRNLRYVKILPNAVCIRRLHQMVQGRQDLLNHADLNYLLSPSEIHPKTILPVVGLRVHFQPWCWRAPHTKRGGLPLKKTVISGLYPFCSAPFRRWRMLRQSELPITVRPASTP